MAIIDTGRRRFILAGSASAVALATPSLLLGADDAPQTGGGSAGGATRNISSFQTARWQDHFETLKNGAIVCDTQSRALHYWSEDESIYKLYATSVPMTEDLTKRGYTEVTRKVVGPTWRPTPSMLKRDPDLPPVVEAGPDNPLGSHALYLSWTYYRIHGTHDTRKIGRRASSGCIGLFNSQIAELFELATVGTQVRLI